MGRGRAQVMCLETTRVYPDPAAAAAASGCAPVDVVDACLGRLDRAGGYSWALVVGGWVLGCEERPERRLVRKWTVEDHRGFMEAGKRLEGRTRTAPGGDNASAEKGRGDCGGQQVSGPR